MSSDRRLNALARESSPYLLQHASNPVDWFPWGEEALARARDENKLIFLSIGYAACHWCHVMEHECFEDEEIAQALNDNFVSIKVDREERPDLDEIYMTATMLYTGGHGGWPMSVFLAPDLRPVYAGTYFPKNSAYGRPGFKTILEVLAGRWRENPDSLTAESDKVVEAIRSHHSAGAPGADVSQEALFAAAQNILRAVDPVRGGIPSGSNKFPPSLAVPFLLRQWKASGYEPFLDAVELTLEKMLQGGIYDHLGGGIHRYSTDTQWLVPHFEKMLYDQALVVGMCLDGLQATSQPALKRLCAERVRGICDYVLRDLPSPEGGFYSSEDADSEGLEGKFYIWTREEVTAVLEDPELTDVFCRRYDVTDAGNWPHPGDSHVPAGPKNILRIRGPLDDEPEDPRLPAARAKLFAVRDKRVRPGLDDKILAGWNGLMITALARAAAVLEEPRYAEAAARAADFVIGAMVRDGRLTASYGKGEARLNAYSTDYAFLVEGLLALFETTGDFTRLTQASELTDTLIRHYADEADGGFFFTADDHEQLLVRSKTAHDGATPSANSVMVENLLKLALLLDRPELRERAEGVLRLYAEAAARQPFQGERLLSAIDAHRTGYAEIVLVGDDDREFLRRLQARYLPAKLVARIRPGVQLPKGPLFDNRTAIEGQTTAYVCREFVCKQPTTDPEEFATLLAAE